MNKILGVALAIFGMLIGVVAAAAASLVDNGDISEGAVLALLITGILLLVASGLVYTERSAR